MSEPKPDRVGPPPPTEPTPLPRWAALLLALASAVLFWAAFPPLDRGWAAWAALTPWLVLIAKARPKTAMGFSFLAGALAFIGLIHWIRFVSYAGWIALALYCGAYWPAGAWLLGWLRRRGVSFVLGAPLVFTLMDYARGTILTGFPFFYLGHSQHRYLPLIQIADLTGVYGITFVIALVNGYLAERVLDRFRETKRAALEYVAAAGVFALVLWYGLSPAARVRTEPGPKVCLVQANVPLDLKHSPEWSDRLAELARHVELTKQGAAQSPDLVIWPETMFPVPMNEAADAKLMKLLLTHENPVYRDYGKALVDCNALLQRALTAADCFMLIGAETRNGERFNSAYYIASNGRVLGRYDKIHLVVFGEYTPLVRVLPFLKIFRPPVMGPDLSPGKLRWLFDLPSGRAARRTPSERSRPGSANSEGHAPSWPQSETILSEGHAPSWPESEDREGRDGSRPSEGASSATHKFGVTICYEDAEARLFRKFVRDGAEFMVNVTNDGWFRDSSELDAHLAVCAFRAVENRVPVVRCANTGISALISPTGRIVQEIASPDGRRRAVEGFLVGELPMNASNRRSFYTRFGDVFIGFCILGLVLTAGIAAWRKRAAA